mgnify:CR=1 FL=1
MREENGHPVLCITGRLCFEHRGAIREAFEAWLRSPHPYLGLDCSAVTEADGHGVALLLVLKERAVRRQKRLSFIHAGEVLHRLLGEARLAGLFATATA